MPMTTPSRPVDADRSVRAGRSRLRLVDLLRTGLQGLYARPVRTALTAGGIAIGVASMVTIFGISASSKADVLSELDKVGTNLLTVEAPESSSFGDSPRLPATASASIRRIPATQHTASIAKIGAEILRNDVTPEGRNGGVQPVAAEPELLGALRATTATGRFLGKTDTALPVVVLGSEAAVVFGIESLEPRPAVVIGGHRFAVVGILDPLPLHPDLDRRALIGFEVAEELFGIEPAPTTVYVRTDPDYVREVREVLPSTINPEKPSHVTVSTPSQALEAKEEINESLTGLLLGLGAVALIVGGVGIANVMVISVLERQAEIGVRRAIGATRRHIAAQFIVESAALATTGGAVGVVIGALLTIGYAVRQDWTIDVPAESLALGVLTSLAIGALAGLYPAVRAARLDPAEAVRPA